MVTARPPRPRRTTAAEYAELERENAQLRERLELADAQLTAAFDATRGLLKLVDRGAFAWPEEQDAINTAKALVTDGERLNPVVEQWLADEMRRK